MSEPKTKSSNVNFKGFDLDTIPMPFGANKILEVLPQRWPLLLVDRVEKISMEEVVAIKANTIGEHNLMGHFPRYPVTPGVVMIEASAQVCTLVAYFRDHHPIDPNVAKMGVRMVSLDDVRLRREVLPGDVLTITARHLNTKSAGQHVYHKFESCGKVGDKIAIEARMTGYFFNDL